MPTERDLREVFDLLEQRAPTDCTAALERRKRHLRAAPIASGRRRSRRRSRRSFRHIWMPAVSAVAVAVMAVTVLVFAHIRQVHDNYGAADAIPPDDFAHGLAPPAHNSATAMSFGFDISPIAGITAIPFEITARYQQYQIRLDKLVGSQQADNGGVVDVFYRGAFDPSGLEHNQTVDVNGQVGFTTTLPLPTEGANDVGEQTPALVWPYAPDAWAIAAVPPTAWQAVHTSTVLGDLSIARAVHAADHPLTLPFTVTTLPGKLRVEAASVSEYQIAMARGPRPVVARLGLADGTPRTSVTSPTDPSAYAEGSAITIRISSAAHAITVTPSSYAIDVGRRKARLYMQDGQVIALATIIQRSLVMIEVEDGHVGHYSATDLKRLLAGMQFGTLRRTATWLPVT